VASNTRDKEWVSGPQPVPVSTSSQIGSFAKFGAGVGAIALASRYQFASGKRGIDYITQVARGIEEYSPGNIFRTFQVSHMLSVFERSSLQTRYMSPEMLQGMLADVRGPGRLWLDHLSRTIGTDISLTGALKEGFRYENRQLLLGKEGSTVLLRHAAIMRAPTGAMPTAQLGYMRHLKGGPLSDITPDLKRALGLDIAGYEAKTAGQIATLRVPFQGAGGMGTEPWLVTGGQSRLQAYARRLGGTGTMFGERINQLARAPFELEPFASIFHKLPGIRDIRFGVTPSSGLKTVGKIAGKLGVLGGLAYYSYKELDHLTRKSEFLDNTALNEGLSVGIASAWTRTMTAMSSMAEATGGHKYREWQEDVAPGSTSLSKLLAFPIMGALGGIGISYADRVRRQIGYQQAGLSLEQASLAAGAEGAFFKQGMYSKEVPSEILASAEKRTIELLQKATAQREGSYTGKIAKWIARERPASGLLNKILKHSWIKEMGPTRMRAIIGAAAGLALVAPFIPGALVPSERPDELKKIYSGEKKVPIRKGRWWEFGRSAYEGERIDRFMPHWSIKVKARAKEKAIWGEDEPSPFKKWYIENFTYELEKKHYAERPYPITGTAFEDIPFLGPILSSTIGRIIKPPKLMHEEDWKREKVGGGEEYVRMPYNYGERPEIEELGEIRPGAPISPYSVKGQLGEQAYRLTEMIGLPGFTMTSIKEAITGSADLFDQEQQLESARRMYGAEREYWDTELGGGLGTTELVRRLYPHRRRQIPLYNPIRNKMPTWLPGPGEKASDFLHGDPYAKIPEGELRLPGAGYAALNPELEGVAPEDYPLFHRFAILSDVAPYSDEYGRHLAHVRAAIKNGKFTDQERLRAREIIQQTQMKKNRKTFTPYEYRDGTPTPYSEIVEASKDIQHKTGFEALIGSYWEKLSHGAETPLEYLTPVSPASKLVHARTAIEDYEKTRAFGTQSAFWQHPIRDFFTPFASTLKESMGIEGIPDNVKEQRGLEEYFDILKYTKYTKLEKTARARGDMENADEFQRSRRETLFGVNPYGFNFSNLYRSLPRGERDYFKDFSETEDMEERARIAQIVPENEKALYLARWKLKDASTMREAIKKGLLSEEEVAQTEETLKEFGSEVKSEGFPRSQELWLEYLETREQEESYGDWYRRTKLLAKQLKGRKMPGPDWVGWHPAVDLNDVKLKVIQNEGRNTYDYDIWPDQVRNAARRPYLEGAAEELEGTESAAETQKKINEVLAANNIRAQVSVADISGATEHTVDVNLQEDRTKEIIEMSRREDIG